MRSRRLLPVLALALLSACARTPHGGDGQPTSLTPEARVAAAREAGESLLQAQAELLWRSWTEGEVVDLTRPFAEHPLLLEPATLEALKSRRGTATGEEARRLDLLYRWLLGEQVARRLLTTEEALGDAYAAAVFPTPRGSLPVRDLGRLLAETPDPEERRRLYAAATPVLVRLQPVLAERDARLAEAARAFGFSGPRALAAALRGVEGDRLAADAWEVLEATESVYRDLLARRARAVLELPVDDLRRADLPRLLSVPGTEPVFPAEQQAARVKQALGAMALDDDARGGVRWHLEAAARKSPQPLCLPVQVPDDVRLSAVPRPGLPSLRDLLREAGTCLHLGWIGAEAFEYRRLGLEPLTTMTAALLDGLAGDPLWLEAMGMGEGRREAAEAMVFERLLRARRHAARLLLATGAESDAATLMARALGFPLDGDDVARLPLERDVLWDSADTLAGLGAAARLGEALDRQFGRRWWQDRGADRKLLALWELGSTLPVHELVRLASGGPKPPDPAPPSAGAALAAWATRLTAEVQARR